MHSEVYFASPASFNDPFDCRVPTPVMGETDDELRSEIEEMLARQAPELPPERRAALAAENIQLGTYRKPEVLEAMRQDLQKHVNGLGVFCVCERPDDLLMWAHYADGHTGFCVEFQHAGGDLLNAAQPVAYQDSQPVSTNRDTSKEELVDNVLLTKAASWAYESEWRRFELERGPMSLVFPPQELTGIIFGGRMIEKDRAQILRWLDAHPTPVAVYEARPRDEDYRVDIAPVEPGL